jgi:rhodanese-related sulfurtransferase
MAGTLFSDTMSSLSELQEDIPPERVAELVREGEVQLVDVRTVEEREAGRIAGSRHIEMDRLTEEGPSLAGGRPIVFYCRVGSRSAVATQAFRASGYDAHNLEGGIVAWVERGLPLEPEDGRVADH